MLSDWAGPSVSPRAPCAVSATGCAVSRSSWTQ